MAYIIKRGNDYISGYNNFSGFPEIGNTPVEIDDLKTAESILGAVNILMENKSKDKFELYERTDKKVPIAKAKK